MYKSYSSLFNTLNNKLKATSFKQLTILNAGWEGGSVRFISNSGVAKTVSISKAGGMAVVVAELPNALMHYGKERGIKFFINSVTPYIGGAMRDNSLSNLVREGFVTKVWEFNVKYNKQSFKVELYEAKTDFGRQFLLKSDAWGGKFGASMSPYILNLRGQEELKKLETDFLPNSPHAMNLMEERAYVVFAKSVAKVYDYTFSKVALLHDYHAGLSVFYNERLVPVLIGHNMAYQGILSFNKNKNNEAIKEMSSRLGLEEYVVEKYFRAWNSSYELGVCNILKAVLKKCRELTGVSATTVSEGYAKELKESYDDLKNRIINTHQNKPEQDYYSAVKTRLRIQNFYKINLEIELTDEEADRFVLMEESRGLHELRLGNVVGILNGLDLDKHASKNKLLRDIVINPFSYSWNNIETPLYIQNYVAKEADFRDGLNYDASQPARVFKVKSVLRRLLLMEFFPDPSNRRLWENKDLAIHYSWGRLVDQKNIPLILSEAEELTKNGDVLILLAANPDDSLSFKIEDFAIHKAMRMQEQGYKFAFSSRFDPKGALFAGGADIVHIPSRYEPCGLTDMEAYWMGTPVVANLVGGLGKGGYAVGNFTADPTSLEDMRLAYRAVYKRAVNIKKYFPEEWRKLCLEALSLDFSYKVPANKYIDVMFLAITKNIINYAVQIAEAYKKGEVSPLVYNCTKESLKLLPYSVREAYLEYGTKFSSFSSERAFFYGVSNETIKELFGD